jgi:hypothetical protein
MYGAIRIPLPRHPVRMRATVDRAVDVANRVQADMMERAICTTPTPVQSGTTEWLSATSPLNLLSAFQCPSAAQWFKSHNSNDLKRIAVPSGYAPR